MTKAPIWLMIPDLKILVIPDLLRAKSVRHLNMLCLLANIEKNRLPTFVE